MHYNVLLSNLPLLSSPTVDMNSLLPLLHQGILIIIYLKVSFTTIEFLNQVTLYAGVKSGNSCFCGNTTGDKVTADQCNVTACSGNSEQMCGGPSAYSVSRTPINPDCKLWCNSVSI